MLCEVTSSFRFSKFDADIYVGDLQMEQPDILTGTRKRPVLLGEMPETPTAGAEGGRRRTQEALLLQL